MLKLIKLRVLHIVKKMTLFDWVFITILFFAGLIVLWSMFKKEEWITVELKIKRPSQPTSYEAPPNWYVDRLKIGDVQYSFAGKKVGEITEIRSWGEDRKETWIVMRLLVQHNVKQKFYFFNYQQVLVGQTLQVVPGQTGVEGLITYIEGIPDNRVWRNRIVEMRVARYLEIFPDTLGVDPWVADAIKKGDKMLDTQGREVAEILSVDIRPAEKVVTTSDGNLLLRYDPIKKDVFLTAKIRTVQQGNAEYFLDDKLVKADNFLPFFLPHVNVYPTITKILE